MQDAEINSDGEYKEKKPSWPVDRFFSPMPSSAKPASEETSTTSCLLSSSLSSSRMSASSASTLSTTHTTPSVSRTPTPSEQVSGHSRKDKKDEKQSTHSATFLLPPKLPIERQLSLPVSPKDSKTDYPQKPLLAPSSRLFTESPSSQSTPPEPETAKLSEVIGLMEILGE